MEKGNNKQTLKLKFIYNRWSVSQPVCLGVWLISGAHDQIFFLSDNRRFLDAGDLSDERMGLSFTGPCQNNNWVQVPQNSRPYFTTSYETLPTWGDQVPISISLRNRVAKL
jgi:hypothetical protein